jgi:hypothetical protein
VFRISFFYFLERNRLCVVVFCYFVWSLPSFDLSTVPSSYHSPHHDGILLWGDPKVLLLFNLYGLSCLPPISIALSLDALVVVVVVVVLRNGRSPPILC